MDNERPDNIYVLQQPTAALDSEGVMRVFKFWGSHIVIGIFMSIVIYLLLIFSIPFIRHNEFAIIPLIAAITAVILSGHNLMITTGEHLDGCYKKTSVR